MPSTIAAPPPSPRVGGKFLQVGPERFLVKGVAYGTFAPDADGYQFPSPARTAADFALMAQSGINTVRTYTVPRGELLDAAQEQGLRVAAGVPWAQHVAFLDDRRLARAVRKDIVSDVRRLSRHPATLLVAIGNEIPSGVVRWHGASRIERFLQDVYDDAKQAAPDALLTYVNYPPTDYLELPFFDVCAFNVYLHRGEALRALHRAPAGRGGQPAAAAGRRRRRQPARGRGGAGFAHGDTAPHRVRGGGLRRGRVLVDRRLVARRSLPSTTGGSG